MKERRNIFGNKLVACCYSPVAGYYRDGYCRTDVSDKGRHVVCAVMTEEFLSFTRSKGNDLTKAVPAYDFPGLKPGDKWCLCALRWLEAYQNGLAPLIIPEACAVEALKYIDKETLVKHAIQR